MSLSDYQKAVLQEMGITLHTLTSSLAETKVSSNSLDESIRSTTLQEKGDNDRKAVDSSLPMFKDITELLSPECADKFNWQQAKHSDSVNMDELSLVTPKISTLTSSQKKQIWALLSPYFNASIWS